jgi:ubiquinone/menaquinone biosynthesis C-methylase UbiE
VRLIARRPPAPAAAPVADPERAVQQAYELILGREVDAEGMRLYGERIRNGTLTAEDLCVELVRSDEFRERLRPPPQAPPATPVADGQVDVRTLIDTLSVEDLAAAADDYYRRNLDNVDYYLAKPLTTIDEAPDFLICFAHVLSGLRPLPGMTVLDFGAGTCWTSRWLTQLGCEVVALDVSDAALDVGRQLYERLPVVGDQPPARFLHFDGRRIDLPDASVDRILCFDSLHHVPNQAEVLRELARVLRDGGVAGFSEPGPQHSRTAQSQFEMRNYTVIENDIVMDDVWRLAVEAGFTALDLAVFSSEPYRVPLPEYERFTAGRLPQAIRYAGHVREFASGRRNFFLAKGDVSVSDSRDRKGLGGDVVLDDRTLSVAAGAEVVTQALVTNTGSNPWLTQGVVVGQVRLGVHLYDVSGRLVDRDYARVDLTAPAVRPGQSIAVEVRVPAPPPGRWTLDVDLVSEHVCWFEVNGYTPAKLEVTVR